MKIICQITIKLNLEQNLETRYLRNSFACSIPQLKFPSDFNSGTFSSSLIFKSSRQPQYLHLVPTTSNFTAHYLVYTSLITKENIFFSSHRTYCEQRQILTQIFSETEVIDCADHAQQKTRLSLNVEQNNSAEKFCPPITEPIKFL